MTVVVVAGDFGFDFFGALVVFAIVVGVLTVCFGFAGIVNVVAVVAGTVGFGTAVTGPVVGTGSDCDVEPAVASALPVGPKARIGRTSRPLFLL